MTATFRGQLVGSTQPLSGSDYVTLAETFPRIDYSILEVESPTLVDDTTATADVVWTLANQVRSDRWTFTISNVQGVTMWTVDEATAGTLTPSLESTPIFTTISQDRYSLLPGTVAGDTVLFEVANNDSVAHELLVLRLDDGISTDVLLQTPGPQLPVGVTMIGQATIAGDGEGQLLLTDLEPGVYTIVCLLPDETGVPHLADGMETTFTVEAP
jgi:plastocyanin